MKSRNWMPLAAVAIGLMLGPGSLRAQSSPQGPLPPAEPTAAPSPDAPRSSPDAPAVAGGDDKPWNAGVPVEQRTAARELFLEANRLFRVPLFAQAARTYEAALRAWKHPAFYFNLALTQLNLAQELEAHDNLERALRYGEEPLGAEQFAEAQQQLRDVERQLGQIEISCTTAGAEIVLDGTVLFTGPGTRRVWAKPHAHEVTAKKPDYLAEARRFAIGPGDTWRVELRLITLDEATRTSRRWAVWKPWAVVGAGTAIAVVAGALHAASHRNFQSYDDDFTRLSCARAGCTPAEVGPALNDRLRSATREQQIAVTGYAIGGAAIAAGAVLLYLNRSQLPEQSTSRRASVFPSLSPGALGVVLTVHR